MLLMTAISRTLRLYRAAYSGHPGEVWTLAVLTLINRMGTMVLPFLPVYLSTILGFTLQEAGILVGAFGLGALAGAFAGGRLSDRVGPRLVIQGSMFGSGLFLIGLQYAEDFPALFGWLFATGMFGESYRPALMAAAGDAAPPNQTGRTMSLLRMAISLGMSIGPAAGGVLAVKLGYNWLFWVDGLTCLAAGLFLTVATRKGSSANPSISTSSADLGSVVHPPHRNRSYLLFLLATFLMGVGYIQWFNAVPVFLKGEWNFDERYIGLLLACNSLLILLLEMPLIHLTEQKELGRFSVLLGLALIGASFLPFLLPCRLVWGFAAVFLYTMGAIFFLPYNNAGPVNMSPPGRRGEYMAWYWMCWSLTGILAPAFALAFADRFGFAALWIVLLLLTSVSWLLSWRSGSPVAK